MKKIICICGPTAVGKTEYSIELAKLLDGEIVSADSMQLYKYMDIGSAKPTKEEQAQVPHHLVDLIDPRISFSVAEYQKLAKDAIFDVFSRGKTPVISGGTGLYVHSLIYNMDFSGSPADEGFRKELEEFANEKGAEALHERLRLVDYEAAERIHPNNIKKVIRAIEVAENTDSKVPGFEESFKPTSDYDYVLVGLCRDRENLYNRIDRRVDILMEMGLLDEIKQLTAMGLTESDISMKGIGYKEIIGHLKGEYDLEEAIRLVKRNTRHYAKRQLTWLKRYPEMNWFNLDEYENNSSKEQLLQDMLSHIK